MTLGLRREDSTPITALCHFFSIEQDFTHGEHDESLLEFSRSSIGFYPCSSQDHLEEGAGA